jgi:hypothetical protein
MLNQGHGSIIFSALRFCGQHRLSASYIRLTKTNVVISVITGLSLYLYALNWRVVLQNQWIVLSGLRSLRIASKDGGPCNEYRIQEQSVEFRAVDGDGEPYTRESGAWRPLGGEEIQLHFALETPVAEWLDKTLYPTALSA